MNRFVFFGIAVFAAVLGIALMGGENFVDAGQRGGGCGGCYADSCDGGCGGCAGASDCCGCSGKRQGLFARMRARKDSCCGCAGASACGCAGYNACNTCCNPCAVPCAGSASPTPAGGGDAGMGEVPPPPDQGTAATFERAPMVYRQASFRR